jgi:hypothetical protein
MALRRRAPAALVLQGLGMIKHEALGGLAAPITFTPNQAHAISGGCLFFEQLTTQGGGPRRRAASPRVCADGASAFHPGRGGAVRVRAEA